MKRIRVLHIGIIAMSLIAIVSSCGTPSKNTPSNLTLKTADSTAVFQLIDSANHFRIQGELEKAHTLADSANAISQNFNWQHGEASALNSLAYVNIYESNLKDALNNAVHALEISEATGDEKNKSFASLMVGFVHLSLEEFDEVLPYYHKSLAIRLESGTNYEIGFTYSYLGNYYQSINLLDSSMVYHELSLLYRLKTDDIRSIADSYLLIGGIYLKQNDLEHALRYMKKAESHYLSINDEKRIAETYRNIAEVYLLQENDLQAEHYLLGAFKKAEATKSIDNLIETNKNLADLKKKQGDYKQAFSYLEGHLFAKDSLFNHSKYREITKQILKHDHEKEKRFKEIEFAQEQERQSIIVISVSVLSAVLLGFLLFIINRLKLARKQKSIIEQQKLDVDKAFDSLEEKSQEILDSINYAKRIQTAILPSEKELKLHLKDHFVLYKPKDIVAGDFYWLEIPLGKDISGANKTILFAAADCTGHGVPGAMVSVICNNGLNASVRVNGLTDPGQILDKTREIVIREFEKSEEAVMDGMDIALCSLNGMKLQYAGANNSLWIVRNGELLETKADKQPIGKYAISTPFTTHHIELEKGDSIYIFTDGYYDQFGGEKGKKFKPANLRKLLVSIQDLAMPDQQLKLDQEFEAWRGDMEQIDDVCIIGVRV
jgi:serine phosphatase RsbU (regulator of sigma subunit)/tetratricopeptide (TPR) repeat protein